MMEEQMQELAQRMQGLQQQLQILTQQMQELSGVERSLDELSSISEDQEILVPFGAGVFLPARAKKTGKILMNVGAGVVVEKYPKDAVALVKDQIQQLKEIEENMNKELGSIMQTLQFFQMNSEATTS